MLLVYYFLEVVYSVNKMADETTRSNRSRHKTATDCNSKIRFSLEGSTNTNTNRVTDTERMVRPNEFHAGAAAVTKQ